MSKILFFNDKFLQEYNNVEFKHHKLKLKKKIKSSNFNYIGYGSILNNHQICFSSWKKKDRWAHGSSIYYTKSKNEYDFNIDNSQKVLSNKGQLCAHQCIIKDKSNRYLLLGGIRILLQHRMKYLSKKKIVGHSVKCLKNIQTIEYKNHKLLSNKYNQETCKSNGLYLMFSKNLSQWVNLFKTPLDVKLNDNIIESHITNRIIFTKKKFQKEKDDILKGKITPKLTKRLDVCNKIIKSCDWASLDMYDSQPSFFFDNKKQRYVLYTRDNVKTGIRYVEYHESPDLISWEKPVKITIKSPNHFNFNKDNLYYFKVKYYPKYDYYIAIGKYYSSSISGIYLFTSNDGISWDRVSKILNDNNVHCDNCIYEGSPIISKDKRKLIFYSSYKLVELHIYELRIDGYASICNNSKDSKEGVFITKKIKLTDNIIINCESEQDGYIIIELLDSDMNSFHKFPIINGNNIEKILSTDFKGFIHVKVTMKKSNIYSIIVQ